MGRWGEKTDGLLLLIWTTNSEGELTTGHSQWKAFTGQSFEELQGLGWLDAVHPDDRSRATDAWFVADVNKTICQVEYRLSHHSGEYRYMNMRAVPLLNADGCIREWFGVHTDISDRKLAEQALKQSEQRFLTEVDTNEIIAPPDPKIEMLYELAMKGNFREIIKQAALLEEIEPKYIPFAKKLHQMAKDFQDEEILTFIQSYK